MITPTSYLYYLNQDVPLDMRLINSSSMIVSGPTMAGKTTFVNSLLHNCNAIFKQPISKIYWICNERPADKDCNATFQYIEGIPESFAFVQPNSIIVLDDLMCEAKDCGLVTSLFTRLAHHKNTFIIYITQNFYAQSKEELTRRRNCQYLVLFKNPADVRQIQIIGAQMYPNNPKLLPEVFQDAVNTKAHGYLLIDLRQETLEFLRLRTDILPLELPMGVYKQPKSK